MTEVDISFVGNWSNSKITECNEWLDKYPHFGEIDIDGASCIMYFEDERDAMLFMLRWS